MPKWPHDDTASLTAFYGKPGTRSNLVLVVPPWQMTFEGRPIKGVQIHKKCAESLKRVFAEIAEADEIPPEVTIFDGSFADRSVRGSTRASCHAFGAAIDLDAEHNPMNTRGYKGTMPELVVDAFKREGWFWGGDFKSRKDPMHFQAAHEGTQVAEAELPPEVDGHRDVETTAVGLLDTTSAMLDKTNTIITQVKPITKSRISIGAVGLGASATASVASAAPPTLVEQFLNIWKSPFWWLILLNVSLTAFILYHYWRDHGRGALRDKGEF